jgi:polar amino acid transport system substrate-binding protein
LHKNTTPSFITLGLLLLLIHMCPVTNLFADAVEKIPETEEYIVGIRVAPPFVIQESEGAYSGLSIELWEEIARELRIEFQYRESDLSGLLQGVEDGSLFASISALTITSEREETIDFTHPFFVTGLGIAVAHKPAGLWSAFKGLFSSDFIWVIFLLIGLLLFWGTLIWVFERRENSDEFGGSAAEGIGSGFWWAAVTMTTVGYGDKSPRSVAGRVIGFIWMFTAIIVISFLRLP